MRVSRERACSELASECCSEICVSSKKFKSWHRGWRKHSWDGSIAFNSRTSNTRNPALTLGLRISLNPKSSFYVFIDFTPWQLPQTCLAQRAAAHRGLPLNRAATKSTLGTGVVALRCLCCPTPLPIVGTSLAIQQCGPRLNLRMEGGCTSDPALWSVLIDLFPFC